MPQTRRQNERQELLRPGEVFIYFRSNVGNPLILFFLFFQKATFQNPFR